MSKRQTNAKRKMSPYKRYGKREYVYPPAYQAWAAQFRPVKASQRRSAQA